MLTRDEIADRFRRLSESARKVIRMPPREPSAPPPEDPGKILADSLSSWAASPESGEVLGWIDRETAVANLNAHIAVGSPQGAYWLGAEAGLRHVRDAIKKWQRGEPAADLPRRPA